MSAVPTPLPCQSSRTAIPILPTCRTRGLPRASSPRSPTTSPSTQATSECVPSGVSAMRLRHASAEGNGNCKVPAIAFGPLKTRRSASQSSGSARRTSISTIFSLPNRRPGQDPRGCDDCTL